MKLPRLILPAAALLAAAVPASAQTQSVESFRKVISREVGYRYLLHLPPGYAAEPGRAWPLLVFLHGSGERGDDPWIVAKHGPPKLLRTPAAEGPAAEAARLLANGFIVVSPQCPTGTWWDDDAVLALVDEIAGRYRVDPARVHLTGLSMGGFGAWSLALNHPARFATVVPICGGGNPSAVRRLARNRPAELKELNVWAFHGAKDPTVALSESEVMVGALRQAGVPRVQFTVYPEARHDSWTETYDNPALYTWLLEQRR